MRVLGYTWAGVRTSDLNSAAQFFAETLGLPQVIKAREHVLWIPGRRLQQRERNFSRSGVGFVTDVSGSQQEAWI